jgi:hypothetical protein
MKELIKKGLFVLNTISSKQLKHIPKKKVMWINLTDYDTVRLKLKGILTDQTKYDIHIVSKTHSRLQVHDSTIKEAIELITFLEEQHQIEVESLFAYKFANEVRPTIEEMKSMIHRIGPEQTELTVKNNIYVNKYREPLMMITKDGEIKRFGK